jgi:hypothetical protein
VSKPLAALAALAGFFHAGDAAADVFYLTSPYQTVIPPPPLPPGPSGPQTSTEAETPGRVTSREFVSVGIGPEGAPLRITATQRLRVDGTGDYSFVVPAPATSVVRGPGSESLPGLRNVGIVWQGFSNRRRVLSARATLRPVAAAAGLPLRVRLQRRAGSTVVRLMNLARRRLPVLTGRTRRADLVAVLERLRVRLRRSQDLAGLLSVRGEFGKTTQLDVAAPLRVTGTISQGTSRMTVDELLGGGQPLERTFVARGMTSPTLSLRVEVLRPVEILPTRRELAGAPRPLLTLQAALGAAAISRAYGRYLSSPDPLGPSEASYVYRSVPKPAAVATRVRPAKSETLRIVLVALLAVAGVALLAAVWARS